MIFANGQDPLSGGAGWVGAGLLGLVLAWLLWIHLPAKDKMITSLVESRDQLVQKIQDKHEVALTANTKAQADAVAAAAKIQADADKERREDHKTVLQMVIDHCQRENTQINITMTKALDEITQAVVDLRRAMEEHREFASAPPPEKKT